MNTTGSWKTTRDVADAFVRGFEFQTGNTDYDVTIRVDGMQFVDMLRDILKDSKWNRAERREISDMTFQTMLERDYFLKG